MRTILGVLLAVTIALSRAMDAHAEVSNQPFVANKEDFDAAARAFGFCRGQALWLASVRMQHPDLAPRALLVERTFHSKSGSACAGLEKVLRTFMEERASEPWAEFASALETEISKRVSSSLESVKDRDIAVAFLDEMSGRSNGELLDDIAQPLISASPEYWKHPVLQWPRWTRVWRADGHAKAHGYKFAVRVPVAFHEKEPTAAHMLRKWSFSLGEGAESLMLGASVFPTEGATLQQLIDDMRTTTPLEMAKSLNEGVPSEILDAKQGGLLMRPAVFTTSRTRTKHLQLDLDAIQYVAVVPSRVGLVVLYCTVVGTAGDATLTVAMERYRPLCDLFFSSFSEPAGE